MYILFDQLSKNEFLIPVCCLIVVLTKELHLVYVDEFEEYWSWIQGSD
jgi:hypothetical protein